MSDWLSTAKARQAAAKNPKPVTKQARREDLARTLKSLHSRGAAKLYSK